MATKRVRMLTTATGPTLHCEAGKCYDLPAAIADEFLKTKPVEISETINVDGKDTTTTRKLGTVGPFAVPDPTGKPQVGWKRDPNPKDDE
jgi:hypothetical protein